MFLTLNKWIEILGCLRALICPKHMMEIDLSFGKLFSKRRLRARVNFIPIDWEEPGEKLSPAVSYGSLCCSVSSGKKLKDSVLLM